MEGNSEMHGDVLAVDDGAVLLTLVEHVGPLNEGDQVLQGDENIFGKGHEYTHEDLEADAHEFHCQGILQGAKNVLVLHHGPPVARVQLVEQIIASFRNEM